MRTFRYDKLVRDKILPDMEQEGSVVTWRKLSDEDYATELIKKLEEELDELKEKISDRDKSLGELADVSELYEAVLQLEEELDDDAYEVALAAEAEIAATSDTFDIDLDELAEAREEKNQKFGAFLNRIYIETITIDEANPWMQRYLADPLKYPEVL